MDETFQEYRRIGVIEKQILLVCDGEKVKQCTILWHENDLRMSHVDSYIVSSVLADIDSEYGKITKNDHHRGG